MVDPLALLRWSVFRLGLLMAILALTLLVPAVALFCLMPEHLRQSAGHRAKRWLQSCGALARLRARSIPAETAAA